MTESKDPVGSERRDGKLYGWTGLKCEACKGYGERYNDAFDVEMACPDCAGTGEKWGLIPNQELLPKT